MYPANSRTFQMPIGPVQYFDADVSKVIGTNHVLPTRKASRYTGGLSVLKFLRTVTYQEVSSEKASGELGRLCGRAARAETFEGHARSGDLRASKFLGDRHPWIDGSNSKSKL
jgi:histidinol dehydrogenase